MRSRTRRGFWLSCVTVLFLAFLAGVACAQEAHVRSDTAGAAGFPIEGEVVGDAVSIRSRSSMDATRLAFAYKGDKLRVLGETGEWYQIFLPREYTMWVTKDLVVVGANKEAVINADNVRARAGAGLQYETVGHLDRGRRVEVLDEKDGWLKFRFVGDDRGYISIRYVRLEGEASPRGVAPSADGTAPEVRQPVEVRPEPEVEQKVMEDFNRAEEIYRQEVKKESITDWKLDEAHTLYVGVLEKTRNKNLVQKCRSRCAVIALARRYQQATKTAVDPRKRLEEREKEIEEEFERKRQLLANEIHQLFPSADAVGRLEKLASPWLRPATHKLIRDDRVTHLLLSETVDLAGYEGKLVGIEGEVDKSVKWPIPALKVTRVVLPPAKSDEGKKPEPEKPPATEPPTDTDTPPAKTD